MTLTRREKQILLDLGEGREIPITNDNIDTLNNMVGKMNEFYNIDLFLEICKTDDDISDWRQTLLLFFIEAHEAVE